MNSWDSNWEKIFKAQEWGKYPSENLIQFVARNFYKKNRAEVKLLEVGCGTGANIWYMSREGFNVSGIDGSDTAIKIAQERMKNENLNARLIVGDIISLPFDNMEFDAIIDNECLYSNNEQNSIRVLSEINRVLKNEGLFYSRTFSKEMFIGEKLNEQIFEYNNISDGPLKDKGFVRLINKEKIKYLYGKYFTINSIDKLEYTVNNESQVISEYIIICKKK